MYARIIISAIFFSSIINVAARAQNFDPRPALGAIISAFQLCGPPSAYLLLSPNLYSVVAQRTSGSGCFPDVAAAGPVQGMQVVGQQNYPTGPLFMVRVNHPTIQVDWMIGFNQFTGKIEYLTFQPAVSAPAPLPQPGPTPPSPNPTPPPPDDGSPPVGSGNDGCDLYPTMCQ